ncbi:MAG TPA: hypothetical protein VMG30_18120 [Acidobacteriota bacterium]|nr:hypothetical protein [Acidobacteriota bacterium]
MKRPLHFVILLCMASTGILPATQTKQVPQAEQGQVKRLILKDGSYELVSRYTIEGDRVRYYSAERFAWEELPYSMIDWAATKRYAGQAAHEADERRNEASESAARERKEEDAHLPLVAPGLRIPAPEGVFLLDEFQGKPEWNKLGQSGGDLNKNMGSNILRGIINPVSGSKQTVEIKGPHANVQSHIAVPSLYFSIDPADTTMGYNSTTAQSHLKVVRCADKKGNRIVATIDIAVYGKVREKTQYVGIAVERISDYWVKIAPVSSMPAGEYALVEFDKKGSMNQFVWDFGVNPAAPANPATLVGDPERKEPVLMQKSRTTTKP